MIREISILTVFVFSQSILACEYTDEYLNLKGKYEKASELAYVSCIAAMDSANYWYQHNQCLKANDGKNVSGGCGVVVSNGIKAYKKLESGTDVCAGQRPDSKLYEQEFKNTVHQLKVTMCKET